MNVGSIDLLGGQPRKVRLDAWAQTQASTAAGAFQLWDNALTGARTPFESEEFRILPPQ